MAVKTFTQAEQLTAADTNTYLNNGGLVYVTETSFSSVVAVNIDNCFTASFPNYRLSIDLSAQSANDTIFFQWRTGGSSGSTYTTSDYDWQLTYTSGTTTLATVSYMAQNYGRVCFGYTSPGYMTAFLDITNPQTAFRPMTLVNAMSNNATTQINLEQSGNTNRVTTSFTGIRIGTSSGTATITGKVKIYGYRAA